MKKASYSCSRNDMQLILEFFQKALFSNLNIEP